MAADDQLQVDTQREGDRVVIRLDGELDIATAPLLRSALEEATSGEAQAVVLDLDELRFMDSTGLRIVLWGRERCAAQGQQFAVTAGSSQVSRLLSVSGVGEQLRILSTTDELLV
jgi:anti-sigma B factor antagonist